VPGGPTTRNERAAGAVQGAALAALTYLALYLLRVWQLGALRFVPWLWFAAAVGFALGAFGRAGRRVMWGAAAVTTALVLVVSSTPLVRPLALSLVRRDLPAGAPLPDDVDAVAVLSGGQLQNGLLSDESVERLLDALALAKASRRPLLHSVIRPDAHPVRASLPDQRALAALAGVTRVLAVDSVHATHDEAVKMAAVARRERWRRVALVTSPLHSRRACATFERAGVRVLCAPARSRFYEIDGPDAFPPGPERLRAFGSWLYEVVGMATYRARGWI